MTVTSTPAKAKASFTPSCSPSSPTFRTAATTASGSRRTSTATRTRCSSRRSTSSPTSPPTSRRSARTSAPSRGRRSEAVRIYRDTRFSKDKTPYNTNVGIHFPARPGEGRVRAGLLCSTCRRAKVFAGGGIWPERRIRPRRSWTREAIVADSDGWQRATAHPTVREDVHPGRRLAEAASRPGFDANAHPFVDDYEHQGLLRLDAAFESGR